MSTVLRADTKGATMPSKASTRTLSDADIKAIAHEVHALMSAPVDTQEPATKPAAKKAARKAPAKRTTAKRTTAKRTAAKKPAAKKAQPKKPGRSQQDVRELGRKGWNRALTALAKQAGRDDEGSIYALVTDASVWGSTVKEARDGGLTPAEALALVRDLAQR